MTAFAVAHQQRSLSDNSICRGESMRIGQRGVEALEIRGFEVT